jgi:hypothetical protein
LTPDRVQRLVEELAEATADEQITDRIALVERTALRIRGKEPTTGWPKLAELLGKDGVAVVATFPRPSQRPL